MTLIKERAVEMIQRIPDGNMLYVMNILQNLEALSKNKETDRQTAKRALADILSMKKRLPEDFNAESELQEASLEKYDNFS